MDNGRLRAALIKGGFGLIEGSQFKLFIFVRADSVFSLIGSNMTSRNFAFGVRCFIGVQELYLWRTAVTCLVNASYLRMDTEFAPVSVSDVPRIFDGPPHDVSSAYDPALAYGGMGSKPAM